MTVFELKKYIIDLAFTKPSEAPFVSCYLPLEREELERMADVRTAFEGDDGARKAIDKIAGFLRLCSHPDVKSVAIFAREGRDPYFLALPMAVRLRPHIAVGPLPEVYGLVETASRHEPFIVAACESGDLRIFFVELGRVVREVRVEAPVARQANALQQALRNLPCPWFVLSGTPPETAAIRDASSEWVISRLAGTMRDSDHRTHDLIAGAATILQRHREHVSLERTRALAQDCGPSGSTVAGPVTTLRALRAGCAETVWIAANSRPEPAFICGECATVEWKLLRPRFCVTCDAPYKYVTDSREEIVRLAIRRGCSVEILWAEGPMAKFGGVACTTRGPASRRSISTPDNLRLTDGREDGAAVRSGYDRKARIA